ncbi:sushi, von Willebrand factor type A, EGF and pentraxin domain-containing protein 1-like [Pecten maximus]|uniref:sushi, von Willebrand factor type A, EGF and pentraxin domain-containing protein 1-like n=1 Tax=Pecten maximus TaxID=6579 RepID=UPI00145870A2|nr:sushi, von Willebrand factor type A, EGF and pentraxin domain-containing protein 1-like [Pecten maximus]
MVCPRYDVVCGPLPSFPNGRWVSNGTTFGHTAILECDEGTESVGSTNVQCGVTGTWGISTQTCTSIDCGHLPSVTHGHWVSNKTLFGQTAELVCEEGRQSDGVSNVTCGLSGEWNISSLTCNLVDCGPPHQVANGLWTGGEYTYGSLLHLQCNTGTTLIGNGTVNCTANGQWSRIGQRCFEVDCGQLPPVTYGQWISSGTTFGHIAFLQCEEDRKPSGVSNVTCGLSGEWNISSLTCDLVDCGPPHQVANGLWTGGEYTYGSLLHLQCNTGTTLIGNGTVNCTANGQWSSIGQRCFEVDCGQLPPVTYGQWISSGTTFGHIAFLQCEEDRKPSGVSNVTCGRSGEWNISSLTCDLVDCGPPHRVANGLWTGGEYTYGSLLHLQCNNRTTLIGNGTVNCTANGQWSSLGQRCDVVRKTESSSSSLPKAALGGVIGATSAISTMIVIVIIMWRRRKSSSSSPITCGNTMKINTSSM